jgi:hypothetical protein
MAETRDFPDVPRRDDAFLVDDVRVCPLLENTAASPCWWVADGRPNRGDGIACVCIPPIELYGKGR